MHDMNRRRFLTSSAGLTAIATLPAFATSPAQPAAPAKNAPGSEPARPSPIDGESVKAFVSAAHRDLGAVRDMLSRNPQLIHATWDWGAGDWETALGAAGHTGNRPIAEYLLAAGARFEATCAAMLGMTGAVTALINASPKLVDVRGPHRYSLMYHIGYAGDIAMAEAAKPHLSQRAADCNQALETAIRGGHVEFVRWLLQNGVDNPNVRNFAKKTPLDVATEKGFTEIARLLEQAGAVRSQ